MMRMVTSLLLILITGISSVNPDQRVTGLKDVDDYHNHERPQANEPGPLTVYGQLNVRNINEVDDSKMVISLEVSLRTFWNDSRLGLTKEGPTLPTDPSPLPGLPGSEGTPYYLMKAPDDHKKLWRPDIFIDKVIKIRKPEFDDAPESIKVYSNRMVRFSKRVNFDIGCNMDFTYYPVDLQKCDVRLESFGYQIEVQLGTSSRAIHGGAYFSAVSGRKFNLT